MSISAQSLSDMFAEPPSRYRHLAIIHGFIPKSIYAWQFDSHAPPPAEKEAVRQAIRARLEQLASWGFGGVVANVVPPDYLENEDQWQAYTDGVKAAADLGMRVWIYDEDGYPSGAAGGLVLRDHPEYEAQSLVTMRQSFSAGPVEMRPPSGWWYAVGAELRTGTGVTDITRNVDPDGWLRVELSEPAEIVRYDARRAFEGTHATRNVYRTRRYVNLLSAEAVSYFFDITAQRYLDRLGELAKHVEAVFTDEPSFMAAYFPVLPEEIRARVQDEPAADFDQIPMIAWDASLPERFRSRWGYDLLPELGRLFDGRTDRDLRVRHDFGQMLSEAYSESFFAQQQRRLEPHGIQFSGHVLAEENITHHVASQASVMADLKEMGIPGVDVLSALPEPNLDGGWMMTCKYGSSAAHAAGRDQLMCEASEFVEKVNGRTTTLEERRAAVAVQMALGVTTITSYFSWEGFQDAEIRQLLDFWARIAVVLRNSTHSCDIAVLYPIRTSWTYYKPQDRPIANELLDEPLASMDYSLMRIARGLVGQGLDFDFLDTRDLIGGRIESGRLSVAKESYSLLIIPPGAVMCPKDLDQLEAFASSGGRVLAFEPLSTFALPEIPNPPNGTDLGPGRTPADVISVMEAEFPENVKRLTLEDDWLAYCAPASRATVKLSGDHMIARRSRQDNREFVLIVNASPEPAGAEVDFGEVSSIQVWEPWTGRIERADSGKIEVPGYSALIATLA